MRIASGERKRIDATSRPKLGSREACLLQFSTDHDDDCVRDRRWAAIGARSGRWLRIAAPTGSCDRRRSPSVATWFGSRRGFWMPRRNRRGANQELAQFEGRHVLIADTLDVPRGRSRKL